MEVHRCCYLTAGVRLVPICVVNIKRSFQGKKKKMLSFLEERGGMTESFVHVTGRGVLAIAHFKLSNLYISDINFRNIPSQWQALTYM